MSFSSNRTDGLRALELDFHNKLIPDLKIREAVGERCSNNKEDVSVISWYLAFYFMHEDSMKSHHLTNVDHVNKMLVEPQYFSSEHHAPLIRELQHDLHLPITGKIQPVSKEFIFLVHIALPILAFVGEYDCGGYFKYFSSDNPHQVRNIGIVAAASVLIVLGLSTRTVRTGAKVILGKLSNSASKFKALDTKGANPAQDLSIKLLSNALNPGLGGGIDLFSALNLADNIFNKNGILMNYKFLKMISAHPLVRIMMAAGAIYGIYYVYNQYNNLQQCKATLDHTLRELDDALKDKEKIQVLEKDAIKSKAKSEELERKLNSLLSHYEMKTTIHNQRSNNHKSELHEHMRKR